MPADRKFALFGAGVFGKEALHDLGPERVSCFIDNNPKMVGTLIEGIPVISFQELTTRYDEYKIVITVAARDAFVLAAQLEEVGITDYTMFLTMLEKKNSYQGVETPILHPKTMAYLSQPNKKHVLMVSYYFPPLSGSGVFRSIKFAKYLPQFGWHPTVVATDCPDAGWGYSDESLVREIPENVDVIRLPDLVSTMRTSFDWSFDRNPQLLFLRNILKESKRAQDLFDSMAQTKVGIAELLTFPCIALSWAYDVVRFVEENLDINRFKVLYTTSGPYSAHLVGYYFHEKYHIPWIADYRDSWTKDIYFAREIDLIRPRNALILSLERILLHHADCNITPGGSFLVDDYRNRFQLAPGKIVSISNGYDEADYSEHQAGKEKTDKFTLNFCGIFYVNQYLKPLSSVLAVIQQLGMAGEIELDKVRLRFVGDARGHALDIVKTYGLESILEYKGYVSHEEAVRSNIDANLILHFVGDDDVFRPIVLSKFYDYLRSGTPIMAIAPKNGAVDQILRETGHGKAFLSTQISEMKEMVKKEYHEWKCGVMRKCPNSPRIQQFERKNLTKKLAEVFNRVQKRVVDTELGE